jgi:hypothetical protein
MESLSRRGTLDVPSAFAQFIGILILVKAAARFLAATVCCNAKRGREFWLSFLDSYPLLCAVWNRVGVYTFWVLLPATSHQESRAFARAA